MRHPIRLMMGAAVVCLGMITPAFAQSPATVDRLAADPAVKGALAAARANESQTLEDQTRFCEVPAPPFKEGARADLLKREFMSLGLQNVRIDRVGNVIGDRPGDGSRPRLVVAAHLDTVFPEGTVVKVKRDGNRLSGPGIGDDCRGLAVLVAIAREMGRASIQTPASITFVADVGEEGLGDLRGMKALFGDSMKGQIDRFVSIDGGGLHATRVAVGSHRYRVTFKGPGGHSFADFGLPNPVGALGRAVARISTIQVPKEPRTTFTVGRIGGGTSVNAIPSDGWMEVDLRSSDPGALNVLDGRFREAVARAVEDENGRWGRPGVITAAIELVGDRPAGSMPADSPMVLTAQAAARVLGFPLMLAEGSTDANLPLSLGLPAITIGGGGGNEEVHTTNEVFDTTESWKGTQFGLLVTVALSQK